MSPNVAGSGTAVDEKLAEYVCLIKVLLATSARTSVMCPGVVTCAVKSPPVGLEPLADVPEYAIPLKAKVTVTPVFVCVRVKGEPVGVQTLPILLFVQLAAVPVPAKMFCKSKKIVPLGTVNVAKSTIEIGPVTGGPERFWMVPPVRPVYEPSDGPAWNRLAVPMLLKKATPVVPTVTVPFMLAVPLTAVAEALTLVINTRKAAAANRQGPRQREADLNLVHFI